MALDTPPAAYDEEVADETAWTNTSFDSGSSVCGTTFVAPTSGAVVVHWFARLQANSANQRALASISVATGGTLGSGTVVSAANDDGAIETSQGTTGGVETRMGASAFRYISGLTAGSTYNVVVQKKVFGGNGSIFHRSVLVLPAP
ncbi:hypothetical protein [Actinoplanes palleronii]|uniref:hypothetical protein n=1 Tax=Actinoplanes palleronii TaxID=113570 RepID=UPI001940F2FA|nr:hypothetical protein [Actinoplanes palleronii]